MRIIVLSFFLFWTSFVYTQNKPNPLVILDSKKIGYMDKVQKILDPINSEDISTLTVYKGNTKEKYDSESGVIIITTKKFILDSFFNNYIENSPLKKDIPNTEYLSKIAIIGSNTESKNLPYDELIKYINTTTIKDEEKRITSITFIKPADSQKINPEWKFGALDITSTIEE